MKLGSMVDLGLYDKLSTILKAFQKHKNVNMTIQTAVSECCRLFECGYARVLLINNDLKRLYKKAGG